MAGRKTPAPKVRQFSYAKLEEIRQDKAITRRALSDAVGVAEMTIYNWCIGKSVPDANQGLHLAAALGVDYDALLE